MNLPFGSELGISKSSIKARGLLEFEEATELELVGRDEDGKEHFLVPAAAQAWRLLKAAALAEGVSLFIVSAFRSIERQAELVRRKLAAGQSIDQILAVCAPPGFSEHHTGRAVDLSSPGAPLLEPEFDQTPAFAWLTQRANDFSFYLSYPVGNPQGYRYEPWHWCFHGARAPEAGGS
jgi:D-alanyl-D-alanine carboxypeptidase